jgi:hypothetical protein
MVVYNAWRLDRFYDGLRQYGDDGYPMKDTPSEEGFRRKQLVSAEARALALLERIEA